MGLGRVSQGFDHGQLHLPSISQSLGPPHDKGSQGLARRGLTRPRGSARVCVLCARARAPGARTHSSSWPLGPLHDKGSRGLARQRLTRRKRPFDLSVTGEARNR